MFLLVDAGNSFVKWARYDPDRDRRSCAGPSTRVPPAGLPPTWENVGVVARSAIADLTGAWRGMEVEGVMIANVAGENAAAQLETVCREAGLSPPEWFVSAPACGGVRNGYRQPSQLGCDRFASLIGARCLFPGQALIVATCGTATTIDALSADGHFIGGLILPGLGLMTAVLAGRTAQLPHLDPFSTPLQALSGTRLFADHTEAAIAGGCLSAQVGAIEHARTVYSHHFAAVGSSAVSDLACILSGGAAAVIAPHLSAPCRRVDNLVLIGLAQVVNASTSC